jgi:hypothetical protein
MHGDLFPLLTTLVGPLSGRTQQFVTVLETARPSDFVAMPAGGPGRRPAAEAATVLTGRRGVTRASCPAMPGHRPTPGRAQQRPPQACARVPPSGAE